jgi:beta-N-acetylhexosaminidase
MATVWAEKPSHRPASRMNNLTKAKVMVAPVAAVFAVMAAADSPSDAAVPTLAQLVGQKLVVRIDGGGLSASLLARARNGQIGGVIVHRSNFSSTAQLLALTQSLQHAAAAGGRPKLLVAVDQEGGPVKTVRWIPPTISPRELGELGSTTAARRQGRLTGHALRDLGINTDLAPVADVPSTTSSFMDKQGRTWSFSAATTGRLAQAFAAGLGDAGAVAAMKHFPGLGLATHNTDTSFVRIEAPRPALDPGLGPYRLAVRGGIPLIMLSNAVYGAFDSHNAAGWSRAISRSLLRDALDFRGLTITDSLDGAAHVRRIRTDVLATRAASAGTDLILVTGSEAASASVYSSLLRAARAGRIDRAVLGASYQRIIALKAHL